MGGRARAGQGLAQPFGYALPVLVDEQHRLTRPNETQSAAATRHDYPHSLHGTSARSMISHELATRFKIGISLELGLGGFTQLNTPVDILRRAVCSDVEGVNAVVSEVV